MKPLARNLVSLAVGAALGGMVSSAMGGGFGIGTQSGSGTGNAFAGGAAVADDASVAWSNPAAMTLIPGKQIAGALHIVNPSFKFENTSSTAAGLPGANADGGEAGDLTLIPNGFFTWAFNPKWSFGLALNAPFGLSTEYDRGWRGRLSAVKSEVKAVNINPSVAYKVSDTVSIGGGLSAQKLDAELSTCANVACTVLGTVKADDMGYGGNLGVLIQAAPSTRIGAHYRSAIKYKLEGDASFTNAAVLNGGVRADLKVPDSWSLSVFHAVNQQWDVMGDITRTGWSSIKDLTIIRTTTSGGGPAGSTLQSLTFNWDDTWRYGVGTNYKWSPTTKLRFGVAFDETPTNDVDRTARLPDQDRKWLAFGVQWKPSKTSILDVGYAHEFIKDASINNVTPIGTVIGKFESKVDILSVQYSMSF